MRHAVRSVLCLLAALLAFAPLASFAQTATFNLPAQPLAESLKALGAQANLNVMVSPALVDGKQAPALKAKLSVSDALARLLNGTGLEYHFLNDQTVVIREAAVAVKDPPAGQVTNTDGQDTTKEAGKKPSQDFRLAQVDQGTAGPSAVDKEKEASNKKKSAGLEEIVVTGSRIPAVAGNEVQPVRRYTREDIQNSGQTTMGEFLNTLPDVSTFTNITTQFGLAGAQAVQLHGLPIGTTLTLLDGRRLESNIGGFFDLSNIPLAAVERIEILPVGASAIYGADALAGAVNTILRKDFNGFEADATLEHAPGVNDPSASLAWGKSWERGSVSLIASYRERGEVLGAQREPSSLTHFPLNVSESTVFTLGSDVCAPGNVYSLDGSNLPGLSSPEAGIPAGVTGTPTRQQFAATAGKLNVCNGFRNSDLTPQSQREGVLLSAHYDVAESTDLFTEILFSHGHLQNQLSAQIQADQFVGGTVAAGNPYNPFGQAVNVSFAYPGSGQNETQSTSYIRPMLGVRGSWFSDWHYEATAYLSRDRLHDVDVFTDFQGVANALQSSDPATALNPFTSGAPGTPQLLSSLTDPALGTLYDDRIVSGQGILRGPVLQLPAGALQAVIGGEYSQEKQDTTTTSGSTPIFLLPLHRNSYAAFSEARIPLLAGGEQPQRGERLTLTLAGRYDHSNDYGGKATWQGGLLWRATDTLSLSGSYGQSYEAPRLSDIAGPQSISPGTFLLGTIDPFRGNEQVQPLIFVSGPNFNLKPETGNSSTLGLKYSSEEQHGLRASLTWYDLKISNYIGTQNAQALLDNPSLFPGAVIRAPATPQDQQQGFLGVVTQINDTFYNFGDVRVAGFDADVSYAIDTGAGEFTPSLALANIYQWQSALLPNTPVIDAVSKATLFGVGWAPRWKGTVALAWKRGPLAANVAGRYIGKYLDYQDFIIPNTNEIGNTWIVDANVRYEVGQAFAAKSPWLAGAYVALGAVNLFNKIPPFAFTPGWYDTAEYDIRGRFLHLSMGLRW